MLLVTMPSIPPEIFLMLLLSACRACLHAERTASSPQHGTQPASVPREFREVQAMGSDELVTVLTDSASYQALCSAISSQYGNSKVQRLLDCTFLRLQDAENLSLICFIC